MAWQFEQTIPDESEVPEGNVIEKFHDLWAGTRSRIVTIEHTMEDCGMYVEAEELRQLIGKIDQKYDDTGGNDR